MPLNALHFILTCFWKVCSPLVHCQNSHTRVEVVMRVKMQAEQDSACMVDVVHIEKILAQLLLDF